MTPNPSAREVRHRDHERLHAAGRIWLDGEGDEWVEVEPDTLVLHGKCGTYSGFDRTRSQNRWSRDEVAAGFHGLRRAERYIFFVISEAP